MADILPPTGGPVYDPMLPIPPRSFMVSLPPGTLTYRTTNFPAGMSVRAMVAFENGEGIGPWTAWSNTVTLGTVAPPPPPPQTAPTVSPGDPYVAYTTGSTVSLIWDNEGYTLYNVRLHIQRSSTVFPPNGTGPAPAPGTFYQYNTVDLYPNTTYWNGTLGSGGQWFRFYLEYYNAYGTGPASGFAGPVMMAY